jgi:hypothetical protein
MVASLLRGMRGMFGSAENIADAAQQSNKILTFSPNGIPIYGRNPTQQLSIPGLDLKAMTSPAASARTGLPGFSLQNLRPANINRGLDEFQASMMNKQAQAAFNPDYVSAADIPIANRLKMVGYGASATVPGGLRFAGRAMTSPLAMTGYGVAGTLAAGNAWEDYRNRARLEREGITPEDLAQFQTAMAPMSPEEEAMLAEEEYRRQMMAG